MAKLFNGCLFFSCLTLALKWKTPQAFSVSPKEATLKPSGTVQVEMKFVPEIAAVYEGQAILMFDKEKWKTIKIEGIGKYPHVSLESKMNSLENTLPRNRSETPDNYDYMLPDENVDFGVVDTGSLNTRTLEFHNTSSVNAIFNVTHMYSGRDVDKYFYCSTPSGVIPAHGKTEIRFSYQPAVGGHNHVDYFAVTAIGKLSRTVVKCTGMAKGPKLKASTDHLDFGIVNLGSQKKLTFTLFNSDTMPAIFQVGSRRLPGFEKYCIIF